MDKQRLIFRGHLLDDSKLLTDNKIENKDVVHLIARMEGTNSSQNNNNNNAQANRSNESNIFLRRSPFSPFISFRDLSPNRNNNERGGVGLFGESGLFGRSSLRIISSTYSNFGRSIEYAPQPTLNSDEIRETIAQNLLEVQNMIDYGNYKEFNDNDSNDENNMEEEEDEKKDEKKEDKNDNDEKKEEKNEEKINCFNLNKRILAKGQWVDVKDTVEQWLEAQVIEVSEDNKMVKIHYNHWSTRWDEWIQTNSPRIMPFRYHTRQSTLTNYHSPFPNKKPDMGVTLLSFENLNRNSCVHPSNLTQQRSRNSAVISTSPLNSQNNNNANNEASTSAIAINRGIQTANENEISNNNSLTLNSSNSNSNNNNNNNNNSNSNTNANANDSNRNETSNTLNISNFVSNLGRRSQGRYAEPPPPVPSPKHQEPDPDNHIVKNLGGDGFLGIFREFDQINKVIMGLSSELMNEHNNNTEILTPNKLSEIQNKSYYNLKRLIPILDRTGRIYSDISTFIEHSMKTNQLELLSKNLFADVGRINEDLKYFSADERRRVSQDILSHNTRRENRSGTVNFVPPVNKFETKLINSIPIIDTPYMTGRNDTQISPILDIFIQNNNNNTEEEGSLAEENNNVRNSDNNNSANENRNRTFMRNINIDSFHMEFKANNENNNNEEKNEEEEGSIKNGNKNKKNKNGVKMLGVKTRRNKSKKKDEQDDNISKDEDKKTKKKK